MGDVAINIRHLVNRAISRWYFFAITLVLSVIIARFYIKTLSPKYSAVSLVLIKDEGNTTSFTQESIFKELGILDLQQNLVNETLVMKSSPILTKAINNLGLLYENYEIGKYRNSIIYPSLYVEVLEWAPEDPRELYEAEVTINSLNQYTLSYGDQSYPGEFGKSLELPAGNLILGNKRGVNNSDPILLRIVPIDEKIKKVARRLSAEREVLKSSVIRMSYDDESPARAEALLAELIKVYNEASLKEKNQVYTNSIDLINERIDAITADLSDTEQNVQAFKQRYGSTEVSAEGTVLLKEMNASSKEVSSSQLQLRVLNYVESFLVRNRNNFEFVPTNESLNNLTLSNQLKSFNDLLNRREVQRTDLGPAHPDIKLTERQIQNLRVTIIDNVRSIKSDLMIYLKANQDELNEIEGKMRSLPRKERELVEIERQRGIKENLYLYLLQKREESAISMVATVPNGSVVEPPKADSDPISPYKQLIYGLAIVLGFAIPALFVLVSDLLDNRIRLDEDLEVLTGLPIGAMIANNRSAEKVVVRSNTRTAISETFRLLRANLIYLSPGKEIQTMLVTSSIPAEGKSFIALNLAVSQALSGKKVVIMELDLRKPKQEEYAKLSDQNKGIVNYLINPDLTIEDVIAPSGIDDNLDVIGCGPVPPNPSELILAPRLTELVEKLKERYDFILMDTPPVGMVSDALQLKDFVEASLYVIRIGQTRRPHLKVLKDITSSDKLPNPFLVVNDVPLGKAGYSYGYGYGSSKYYEESPS